MEAVASNTADYLTADLPGWGLKDREVMGDVNEDLEAQTDGLSLEEYYADPNQIPNTEREYDSDWSEDVDYESPIDSESETSVGNADTSDSEWDAESDSEETATTAEEIKLKQNRQTRAQTRMETDVTSKHEMDEEERLIAEAEQICEEEMAEQEEEDEEMIAMLEHEDEEPAFEEWTGETRDERHQTKPDHATLPSWMNYTGSQRPDGVWIEGYKWKNRHTTPSEEARKKMTVHLIEFTVTSEAYIRMAARAKKRQYKLIAEACEKAGMTVKLHILPAGSRGWMSWLLLDSLEALKIPHATRNKLHVWLGRYCKDYGGRILNTRRAIERQSQFADKSGQARGKLYRKLKKEAENMQPD